MRLVSLSGAYIFLSATLLLLLDTPLSHALWKRGSSIKETVFLSPKFELGPGSVQNKFYHDIEFPRGHVAIKSFNGEVIDEGGNGNKVRPINVDMGWTLENLFDSINGTKVRWAWQGDIVVSLTTDSGFQTSEHADYNLFTRWHSSFERFEIGRSVFPALFHELNQRLLDFLPH